MWILLQGYHLLVFHWLADWLLPFFPQAAHISDVPNVAIASVVNLVIFGTLAVIWPRLGFGDRWKPNRSQSLTVFFLIGGALLFGQWIALFTEATGPFKPMGFIIWTITPIEEEILFRGFLHAWLVRVFNVRPNASFQKATPAILLGAAWFALWHLVPDAMLQYGWEIVTLQTVWTFAAGILFGTLRHWTGSIWLTIPVHAAGNFIAVML